MHTRPDRTRGGSTLRSHAREAPAPAVHRARSSSPSPAWSPPTHVPPFVTYVLVIASFGLLFEAGTAWFARAGGTGGLKDFRQ